MFEWSEEQLMIRDAVRQFVEAEIATKREDLEHGDLPPYDILRKLFTTFGMDQMAKAGFEARIAREKRIAAGEEEPKVKSDDVDSGPGAGVAMTMIPIIEICRYSPGIVTAMGVSMGLTSAAIMSKGTIEQKERWALPLLTLEKVGAWAITEPGSGSDAFGSMKATARRDGDEYLLNGSKTFITNGPYADTTVFICKLDEGNPPAERKILSFILDKGMPGFVQSKPLRKMGMHSSPTGELFLDDVRVGKDRLIGGTEDVPAGGREGAKDTFSMERSGVAAMSLGIIDKCLELCVQYSKDRVQFGQPIGEFQLIQEKLAMMEVARLNVQNLVFRFLEMGAAGRGLSLAEASAMKLYSARAADRGGDGGRAAPRWQRVHGRVPRRAARPGRQGPPDLRRHRRDPDHPHRQGPPTPLNMSGDWRRWVEGAVGPGATTVRSRRMHGGVTSVVRAVDVDDRAGTRHRLVLRTHPAGGCIEQEPGLVADEVRALSALESAGVGSVPRLVAADEDGSEAGRPSVLSTRLSGRPIVGGMDEDRWVDGLAEAVVGNVRALQAVASRLGEYRPWHEVGPDARVIPPDWVRDPSAWVRAMQAIVHEVLPSAWPQQPIHRDCNPGNLLWHRGRVTGVVDWVNLCHGPVEDDVARCRVNVWLLAGQRAADRFLAATDGAGLPYDRRWDRSLISDMCHHLDGFADAAGHLGREVSTEEVRERAQEIARSGV